MDEARNAITAIEFYRKNTKVPHYQRSPENLVMEIADIDFAKTVKIRKVRPGVLLTQMQQEFHSAKEGNFYTVGSLPSSLEKRASESGIGFKSMCATSHSHTHETHDIDKESQPKAVYISQTTGDTVFLEAFAAPTVDHWSVKGLGQKADGGGIQYRISDTQKSIERLEWGVVRKDYSPHRTKPLSKGIGVAPAIFRRR